MGCKASQPMADTDTGIARASSPAVAASREAHPAVQQSPPMETVRDFAPVEDKTKESRGAFKPNKPKFVIRPDLYDEGDASYAVPVFEKSEPARVAIEAALLHSVVFDDLTPDQLYAIIDAMEEQTCAAGDKLVRQGDAGDCFFVIVEGCFAIYVDGAKVGESQRGASFGELALLTNQPRNATLTATVESCCFKLERRAFRHLIAATGGAKIESTKRELEQVKILKGLPEAHLFKLAMHTNLEIFPAGDKIIAKGDVGDKFYMLKRGIVSCRNIGKADQRQALADVQLPEGAHFGERAFTHNEPRACDVFAKTDVEVLVLSGHDFEMLLGSLSDQMAVAQASQVAMSVPGFDTHEWDQDKLFELFERCELGPNQVVSDDTSRMSDFLVVSQGEIILEFDDGFVRDDCDALQDRGAVTLKTQSLCTGSYIGAHALQKPETVRNDPPRACRARTGPEESCVLYRINLKAHAKAKQLEHTPDMELRRLSKPAYESLSITRTLGCGTFGRVKLAVASDGKAYALKILCKATMVESEQTSYILRERTILLLLSHPFVLHLYATYHSRDTCYFLLEFVQGGELFSYIEGGVGEDEVCFLGAHVIDALEHMHAHSIVFRDLKPENVLLDSDGYCRVVDFGFAKVVEAQKQTYTILGTPEYLSPECVLGQGYRDDVDLWAYGVLTYEMLTGRSPFVPPDPDDTLAVFRLISAAKVRMPRRISACASSFVRALLARNRNERVGFARGAETIKQHLLFEGLDWDLLRAKKLTPPKPPALKHKHDTSAFDPYDENMRVSPYFGSQIVFLSFGDTLIDDRDQHW